MRTVLLEDAAGQDDNRAGLVKRGQLSCIHFGGEMDLSMGHQREQQGHYRGAQHGLHYFPSQ